MPFPDPTKSKEYIRLSSKIWRAKRNPIKNKERIVKLLAERDKLTRITETNNDTTKSKRSPRDLPTLPACPGCGKEGKYKINCSDCMLRIIASFKDSKQAIERKKKLDEKFKESLLTREERKNKREISE